MLLGFFRAVPAFRPDDRGTVAIEAAAATPFLVLLVAGVIEFGNVFYNHELIQTGIRDAARYLARVQDPAGSEAAARNLAVTGSVVDSGSRRVAWWQTSQVQITYRQTSNPVDAITGLRAYRGNDPLTTIRVETTVSYPGLALLRVLGFDQLQITAAHEERHVGQ